LGARKLSEDTKHKNAFIGGQNNFPSAKKDLFAVFGVFRVLLFLLQLKAQIVCVRAFCPFNKGEKKGNEHDQETSLQNT
jgi:hypothetical protein